MKKMNASLILFIILGLLSDNIAISWDNDTTHMQLSEYAAKNSVLDKNKSDYLRSLGFGYALETSVKWGVEKTITKWIQEGAQLEDSATNLEQICGNARSYNHFHNPLKPWNSAGLDDDVANFCPPFPLIPPIRHATGESSLLWMQDGANQQNFREHDWSWLTVRNYYYSAVTSTVDAARQVNFAKTFRGLGHQMHLIQDTGQPDHVRNDAHPMDAVVGHNQYGDLYFEKWAKTNSSFIVSLATSTVFPIIYPNVALNVSNGNLAPITQFIDTDSYVLGSNPSTTNTQGLAEYTNANFASDDTIFTEDRPSDDRHYFPYPRKTSTNLQNLQNQTLLPESIIAQDGVAERNFYIKKNADGEQIEHFVRPSYFTNNVYTVVGGGGYLYYLTFYRDEACHIEYAQKLIPRAVGYSAGLLNYFFRGTLEISAPSTYVYSIIDGSATPQQFTRIKAKVKNNTPNESVGAGILQVVARYKIVPTYAHDLSNYPPDGTVMSALTYSYSISTSQVITSLSSTTPAELTFDFTQSPIPAGITDLTLQVVFKGTLGNETDTAVAVGMKDIMEPTHLVFWNLTDMFSLDGHLYTADQIRADPNLLAKTNGAYIDRYDMTFEISSLNESPPVNPVIPVTTVVLPAGRHLRLIALVDKQANNYVRLAWSNSVDSKTGFVDFAFTGVVNQADANGVWQTPTPKDTFRYWLAPDGMTRNPITQHFRQGVLRCEPYSIDPATGNKYCAYPDEESIAAEKTAYPGMLSFP